MGLLAWHLWETSQTKLLSSNLTPPLAKLHKSSSLWIYLFKRGSRFGNAFLLGKLSFALEGGRWKEKQPCNHQPCSHSAWWWDGDTPVQPFPFDPWQVAGWDSAIQQSGCRETGRAPRCRDPQTLKKSWGSEQDWCWVGSVLGELIPVADLPTSQRCLWKTVVCWRDTVWPQGRTEGCFPWRRASTRNCTDETEIDSTPYPVLPPVPSLVGAREERRNGGKMYLRRRCISFSFFFLVSYSTFSWWFGCGFLVWIK